MILKNTCLLDILNWCDIFFNSAYFSVIITKKYSTSTKSYNYRNSIYYILSRIKHTLHIFLLLFLSCLIFLYSFFSSSFLSSHERKKHKPPSMKSPPKNLYVHVVPQFDLILPCHIITTHIIANLIRIC